jgi:hypothetical protein
MFEISLAGQSFTYGVSLAPKYNVVVKTEFVSSQFIEQSTSRGTNGNKIERPQRLLQSL